MKKIFLFLALFISIVPTYAAVDGVLSMEAMQAKQEGNLTKQHVVAQKIISKNAEKGGQPGVHIPVLSVFFS